MWVSCIERVTEEGRKGKEREGFVLKERGYFWVYDSEGRIDEVDERWEL